MSTSELSIPVTILSGFLGAGKTTLLNNILRGEHGLRVAVLVNDFGSINIDAALVADREEETVNLSNGCICCTIRGDLLAATLRLVARDDPPEYIVVEASGVSDPAEVARTFLAPELRGRVRVDGVLTVVDAEQLSTLQGENAILALDQIGVADVIILNKVDLVGEAALARVRKDWIQEVAPRARVYETTYSQVPLELLLGVGGYAAEGFMRAGGHEVHVHQAGKLADHAHDHALVFHTWSWQTAQPLSRKALQKAINDLPPSIFRAKGWLYLADDPARRYLM
ncbi:MAG: CobW family GTP-binding protein, partial [Anaerolineales bacterium]